MHALHARMRTPPCPLYTCTHALPPPGPLQSGGDVQPGGRRLFVFVVGGVAYSEMRAVHRLSSRLHRDVFLGSTNVEMPAQYLADLAALSTPAQEGEAFEVETPLRNKF